MRNETRLQPGDKGWFDRHADEAKKNVEAWPDFMKNTSTPRPKVVNETRPIWEIADCLDGYSGRGDIARAHQAELLNEGWEPFAVSNGSIWFRRLRNGK